MYGSVHATVYLNFVKLVKAFNILGIIVKCFCGDTESVLL